MISDIIYYTLKNKDKILSKTNRFDIKVKDALQRWKRYTPSVFKSSYLVSSIDGSMNYMNFREFVLYAVDSMALIYDGAGSVKKIPAYDVDILYPYNYTLERIRNYMRVLEIKVALKALQDFNPEITLIDGSLISHLTKTFIYRNINKSYFNVIRDYRDIIKKDLNKPIIASKKVFELLQKEYEDFEKISNLIMLLEHYEHLLVIRKLLEVGKNNIVAIAKTSSSRRLFRASLKPDLTVFNKFTLEPGYSIPTEEKVSKRYYYPFIDITDDLKFTVFYARLEKFAPVFRFEIPGEVSNGYIERIMDYLSEVSVNGYPYPLKSVHNNVEITINNMLNVYRSLSLYGEETGREELQ